MDYGLLLASLSFLFGVVSPGPSNMAISYIAINFNRKKAIIFALGVFFGSMTWGLSTANGITYVVTNHSNLIIYLKIISAGYFLYLAYILATGATDIFKRKFDSTKYKQYKLFISGYLFHLLNPKAMIVWSSVMTIGISNSVRNVYVLLAVCLFFSFSTFISYGVIFSHDSIQQSYNKYQAIINKVIAFFFVFVALQLLFY